MWVLNAALIPALAQELPYAMDVFLKTHTHTHTHTQKPQSKTNKKNLRHSIQVDLEYISIFSFN